MGPFLSYGRAVEAMRAEAMPGPHWYLAGIGVEPTAQRQGSAARSCGPGSRRPLRRAAAVLLTNTAGEPFLLRPARLRGRPRGRHAGERPACLGYGQVAVSETPKRFPDRDEIVPVRTEAEALETGEEGAETRRLAGRVMARRDMGKLVFLDLVDRSGRIQLLCPRRAHGRGGRAPRRRGRRDRQADEEPPRRAVADRRRARPAVAHPLAAPRHVPRTHRRRAALPQALPRPADERGDARHVHPPLAHRHRGTPLSRRGGLRRGRDADPAAALRRRVRRAVRHAPQRARPGSLPPHRDRAVSQAADRRRAREGLRDRQGLPQRGRHVQEQPRVHDARVVRGVRGLRGHDARGWSR